MFGISEAFWVNRIKKSELQFEGASPRRRKHPGAEPVFEHLMAFATVFVRSEDGVQLCGELRLHSLGSNKIKKRTRADESSR